MRKSKIIKKLPKSIRVKVSKGKSGCFIAELPEYKVFTEADSPTGIEWLVNDLIYTLFDIPSKYHGKIWYKPEKINQNKEKTYYPYMKMTEGFDKRSYL